MESKKTTDILYRIRIIFVLTLILLGLYKGLIQYDRQIENAYDLFAVIFVTGLTLIMPLLPIFYPSHVYKGTYSGNWFRYGFVALASLDFAYGSTQSDFPHYQSPSEISYKSIIASAVQDLDKHVAAYQNAGSFDSLAAEANHLTALAAISEKGAEDKDAKVKNSATHLQNDLSAVQKAEFPNMRQQYVSLLANKLLEDGAVVTADGPGNTILNLTGTFTDADITNREKDIYNDAYLYRFKEIRFTNTNNPGNCFFYLVTSNDETVQYLNGIDWQVIKL